LSAPYFAPTGFGDKIFALVVTSVAVFGVVSLVHAGYESGFRSSPVAVWVAWVVWLGSFATISTSAAEARFALPLVLLGIAGCARLTRLRLGGRWVAAAVTAVFVVFAVGAVGLSHPAAPGPVTQASCAAT
jgi:hypothetical protein